jgi:hypothetical protein
MGKHGSLSSWSGTDISIIQGGIKVNYNDPRIEKMKDMSLSELFDSVFDRSKKGLEEAIRKCAELEEENRRLRAVAVAVSKYSENCVVRGCGWKATDERRKRGQV